MNKKILLGIGSLAAAALPVSVVVACNGDDGKDKDGAASSSSASASTSADIKVNDTFTFSAANSADAILAFNTKFKTYIDKAAKGFAANVDAGKNSSGSASPVPALSGSFTAKATAALTNELNGKTVVGIFMKGNNTLFLLKDNKNQRPYKADKGGDMQLTYPAARSDDNDASKAKAGLMADFGDASKPAELKNAIVNNQDVTSILGFYNYAQQETNGGAYYQSVYYLKGLYNITGSNNSLVNAETKTVTGNVIDIEISQ